MTIWCPHFHSLLRISTFVQEMSYMAWKRIAWSQSSYYELVLDIIHYFEFPYSLWLISPTKKYYGLKLLSFKMLNISVIILYWSLIDRAVITLITVWLGRWRMLRFYENSIKYNETTHVHIEIPAYIFQCQWLSKNVWKCLPLY